MFSVSVFIFSIKKTMEIILIIGMFLSGTVTDKNTHETLVGVEVKIGDASYYTDLDGKFTISDYNKSDSINLSYVSYSDTTITLENAKDLVVN